MENRTVLFRGKTWGHLVDFLRTSPEHIKLLSAFCQIFFINSSQGEELILTVPEGYSTPLVSETGCWDKKNKAFELKGTPYSLSKPSSPEVLFFSLPLQDWTEANTPQEVLVVLSSKISFHEVVSGLLSFGRDNFLCGIGKNKGKTSYLIQVSKPSYFLLTRWLEMENLRIFYQGQPGLFLLWGYIHPFGRAFSGASKEWVFLDPLGNWKISLPSLTSLWEFLHLSIPSDQIHQWKSSHTVPRLEVSLSLKKSSTPGSPDLWIFSEDRIQDLVESLENLSEERLNQFLLGKFTDGQQVYYVLRKLLGGGLPDHFLPDVERYYMAPYLSGFFLPIDRVLHPPIRSVNQFRKSLGIPREMVILRGRDEKIEILKVDLSGFSPGREVIQYWMEAEQKYLESLLPQIVFDLERGSWKKRIPSSPRKEDLSGESSEVVLKPSPAKGEAQDSQNFSLPREKETNPAVKALRGEASSRDWRDLALVKEKKKLTEQAFQCWIEALWQAEAPEAFRELVLEMEKGGHPLPSFLFRLRPEEILKHVSNYYQELRELGEEIPKKLKWLFWEKITEITGDEVERFYQGESLLSEINTSGIPRDELPQFFLQILEEDFQRKNLRWGRDFLSHFLRDLEKEDFHPQWNLRILTALSRAYGAIENSGKAFQIIEEVLFKINDGLDEKERASILVSCGISLMENGFPRGEKILEEVFALLEEGELPSSARGEILGDLFRKISSLSKREQVISWGRRALKSLLALEPLERFSLFSEVRESLMTLPLRDELKEFTLNHLGASPPLPFLYPLLKSWMDLEDEKYLPPSVLHLLGPLSFPPQGNYSLLYPNRDLYMLVGTSSLIENPPPSPESFFAPSGGEDYQKSLTRTILLRYFIEKKDRGQMIPLLERALELSTQIREENIRLDALKELIGLIPLTGRPREGEELLGYCLEKQRDFQKPLHQATLINYCMKAAGKLGQDRETINLWKKVLDILSEFRLLENSPLFFEVFSVGLEGLLQISSPLDARHLLFEVYEILQESIKNFTQEVYLESNMYLAVIGFARAALYFNLASQAWEALKMVLPRLPQILLYHGGSLQIYRDLAEMILSLDDERRYEYLYKLFSQFYPYFNGRGVLSEEMIKILETSMENLFSLKSGHHQYLQNYKTRWEEEIRRRIVSNMFSIAR